MSFDMNPADEDEHGECRHEIHRLNVLCRKQQEEIENLNGFADAVESLRDIGKVTGCDHVDGPDGRRQLVNCVEQTIDRLEQKLESVRAALQNIVCVDGIDAGVVYLPHDSPTHYDPEQQCQVYDHEYFSPLGDALVALWKLTSK